MLPVLSDDFDRLAGQGALFVNVAWTRTGDEHLAAHQGLWKPVLDHMLQKLARSNQPMVFLLLGDYAIEAFCAADPVCRRFAIVDDTHPRSPQRFDRGNSLERVNQALAELEAGEVRWWPELPPAPA